MTAYLVKEEADGYEICGFLPVNCTCYMLMNFIYYLAATSDVMLQLVTITLLNASLFVTSLQLTAC